MVVADFIALCLVLGLLGIGGKSLFSAFGAAHENRKAHDAEQARMREDLRVALASHNKQKLEDFLVLWGDKLPKAAHDHVKQRIDELFLEENQ